MKRFFRRYGGFTRCAMEEKMAYKKGFFMNGTSQLPSIFSSILLWRVLFMEQSTIQGYNWDQMILYALITSMLNATLSFNTEMRLSEKIRNGSVASNLTKPIDFQNMCFFEALGQSLVEGGNAAGIVVVIAVLFTDLSPYLSPLNLLLFFLSLFLAFLLKFSLAYIGGLMGFFTSNGYGIAYFRQVITDIFSGAMLPLAFFPRWFQSLAGALPFQASVYLPTQIFLGRVNGREAIWTLLLQVFWVIVMWVLGKILFGFAVRKVTIQGG